MQQILPLNALRAIEAVGRLGGLEPAAAELGVTIGAVSQHLRRAEARLGVALFERTPRGLVPSPDLAAQLPTLRQCFATLDVTAAALNSHASAGLTLTVGNVFASRWLVSRLARFTTAYPDIEVRIVATGKLVDLSRSDIDCGIRYGSGDWPGTRAELLGGHSTALPVTSPELARRLKTPADLATVPVIHDEASMLSWPQWCRAAGLETVPALSGPTYSDPALAFEAAAAGQGVLLAVEMMAADALADGRLVAPFAARAPTELGYWFATSADRYVPPKVKRFKEWLEAEVNATVRRLVA